MYEDDFNKFLDYVNKHNDGKYIIEINTGGNYFSYGMHILRHDDEHAPRS